MVFYYLLCFICLFIVSMYFCNMIKFKLKVGPIGLNRKNEIETTLCLYAIIMYIKNGLKNEFMKDLDEFWKLLELDTEYTTLTHSLIRKEIRKRTNKIDIKEKKVGKRGMFWAKIFIGNFLVIFLQKNITRKLITTK